MAYRATPTEWLALGAIAQQESHSIRYISLRVFIKEYLGIVRPLSFIHSMVRGGLITLSIDNSTVTLTEWGCSVRRSTAFTRFPWYIPVPRHILEVQAKERH